MRECSSRHSGQRRYNEPNKRAGGRKKAPGNDGLGREFYSHNWAIINRPVGGHQQNVQGRKHFAATKRGVVVCMLKAQGIPNTTDSSHPSDSDYKILARIIAKRLRPVLADHLTENQFFGVSVNRSLARWQRNVILSRTRKTGGSHYACFPSC
jgi:hypothetical protein